jgi:hypothetical protein
MRWLLNDASLCGQYHSTQDFIADLVRLLKARNNQRVAELLYITRAFPERFASHTNTVKQAISSHGDRDLNRTILEWLNKRGPFIDDEPLSVKDNYFECLSEDVTNQGLGEAGRRLSLGMRSASVSFATCRRGFATKTLRIDHGLKEELLGHYTVKNYIDFDDLVRQAASTFAEPRSWEELFVQSRCIFQNLVFSDLICENKTLRQEPFASGISQHALGLFEILDSYVGSLSPDGSRTERTSEIFRAHFAGGNGRRVPFSDESDTNKRKFNSELTFPDPENHRTSVFAPWHGKFKQREFRFHFTFPPKTNPNRIAVVYFGPKITKE